jgi:hypothetical protein
MNGRTVLLGIGAAAVLLFFGLIVYTQMRSREVNLAELKATLKDYTDVHVKVTPVAQQKDPRSGFVVGGKNTTALVRKLTEINGRNIADLEKDMRPGAWSSAGFLGPHENLLDVLAQDNEVVLNELNTTHQEIALALRTMLAISDAQSGGDPRFVYKGKIWLVNVERWMDSQGSPFMDGTSTSIDVTITCVDNGKSIEYSALVPQMIERYGFYEGKGTKYRVEPRQIVDVLDFLKK